LYCCPVYTPPVKVWYTIDISVSCTNKELLYEEPSLQVLKQARMGKQLADYIDTNFKR